MKILAPQLQLSISPNLRRHAPQLPECNRKVVITATLEI